MLTFFAFTTGLLVGAIGGALGVAYVLITDKDTREYYNKKSID